MQIPSTLRAGIWPAVVLLVERGLDMTGYTNSAVAVTLWCIAAVLAVVALRPWDTSSRGRQIASHGTILVLGLAVGFYLRPSLVRAPIQIEVEEWLWRGDNAPIGAEVKVNARPLVGLAGSHFLAMWCYVPDPSVDREVNDSFVISDRFSIVEATMTMRLNMGPETVSEILEQEMLPACGAALLPSDVEARAISTLGELRLRARTVTEQMTWSVRAPAGSHLDGTVPP